MEWYISVNSLIRTVTFHIVLPTRKERELWEDFYDISLIAEEYEGKFLQTQPSIDKEAFFPKKGYMVVGFTIIFSTNRNMEKFCEMMISL